MEINIVMLFPLRGAYIFGQYLLYNASIEHSIKSPPRERVSVRFTHQSCLTQFYNVILRWRRPREQRSLK